MQGDSCRHDIDKALVLRPQRCCQRGWCFGAAAGGLGAMSRRRSPIGWVAGQVNLHLGPHVE